MTLTTPNSPTPADIALLRSLFNAGTPRNPAAQTVGQITTETPNGGGAPERTDETGVESERSTPAGTTEPKIEEDRGTAERQPEGRSEQGTERGGGALRTVEQNAETEEPGAERAPNVLNVPKISAVRKLQQRLHSELGLANHIAEAIARSIANPEEVRRRLSIPSRVRVPGGELIMIEAQVFSPTVLPYPLNPRTSESWRWPASGTDRNPLRQLRAGRGDRTPEIVLDAIDVEQVSSLLHQNAASVTALNSYIDSIAATGVFLPVTAVAMRLTHQDGTPELTVLTAADGSSRITACQHILGMEAQHSLYPFADGIERVATFIRNVIHRAGTEPTETETQQLRALQVPARIVIGFEPDSDDTDFPTVLRSLLGLQHVDPPTPWSDGNSLDVQGESVVAALLGTGLIDPDHHDWMLGMLSPTEAAERGLSPLSDERYAALIANLMAPEVKRVVISALKSLNSKNNKQPSQQDRLAVVVELGLRAVRHTIAAGLLPTVRASLREAATMAGVVDGSLLEKNANLHPWKVTRRSPGEIRDAALHELRRTGGWSARRELAVLAGWWFTTTGVLRTPRRSDAYQRTVGVLLATMLGTERGIHLLYQAIVDGRAGTPIRMVDEFGKLELTPAGHTKAANPDALAALFPREMTGQKLDDETVARAEAVAPVEHQLRVAVDLLAQQSAEIEATMKHLTRVSDGPVPLVEEFGIESSVADRILTNLTAVRDLVSYYQRRNQIFIEQHRAAVHAESNETVK